ncbi:MAG: adenylate/guanylate cyclase domain-containing protein, partial [Ketobacteraceae bacterium]|nr:adenylate/guanylate cyclase domain-containing protein [Ketobacteraceae bacterium]
VATYLSDWRATQWMLQRIDFLSFDLRYQLINPVRDAKQHAIVIIDIDELSLKEQGRWPWSREKMAQLVRALYESGVTMVGMDVVFAEPEINPVALVEKALTHQEIGSSALQEWLRKTHDQFAFDQHFAEALGSDTVLGYFLYQQTGSESGVLPEPILTLDPERASRLVLVSMQGHSANIPVLQNHALSAGYLTIIPDPDGVVRRAPMVLRYGNKVYSSLALEMARQFLFVDEVRLVTAMQYEAEVMERIELDSFSIPTNALGQALVPFLGKARSFPYFSATDVLNGRTDTEQLAGTIALVGTSAWGLGDLKAMPLSAEYPGVEVHANLLNGILNSQGDSRVFPHRPDLARQITALALFATGLLLCVILPRLNPSALIVASFFLLAAIVGTNFFLWKYYLLDYPLAPHLLLTTTLTLYLFADGFLRENLQRLRIKKMFGQYVPPAHVDEMVGQEGNYGFEGESKELTVLFSDIRNFTNISETLNASDLKRMLNRYFTPITKIIFDHDGTIDKYVGDMVMAFWGAPLEDPGHASKAVQAALDMLAATERLKPEFRAAGLPEINIGIGINTGLMNVGDMGSEYRRAYTVLGDAVNLGSRLEGVTKFYGVRLLVSETTQAQATEFQYRLIDRIRVKGKSEPITVYEPLCRMDDCPSELAEEVARFHMALFNYYYQRWDKAVEIIEALHRLRPQPIYSLYLERIAMLRKELPGENWDGVFTHTSK